MNKHQRGLLVLGLAGVMALAGLAGGIVWTSRPQSCRSCHQIAPYYDTWQQSAHREIQCGACHWGTGLIPTLESKVGGMRELALQVLGRTDRPLRSQIPDARCTSCHPTLTKTLEYLGTPFLHTSHLDASRMGMQLACTSCHYQPDEPSSENHVPAPPDPCYACHLRADAEPSLQDCMSCHRAALSNEPANARYSHRPVLLENIPCIDCHGDATEGTGDMRRRACESCHPGDVSETLDVIAMHEVHVSGALAACVDCHEPINHSFALIAP